MKKEVRKIISQLKKGEISISEIPSEYAYEENIIETERSLGIRKPGRRGYNVLKDELFVEETIEQGKTDGKKNSPQFSVQVFGDFDSYYSYLNGDIYQDSCYYQLGTEKIPSYIDHKLLFAQDSFVSQTIDDYTLTPSTDELAYYSHLEKRKELLKKWIAKFNQCTTCQGLKEIYLNYRQTQLSTRVDAIFFFWNYIFDNINDDIRFHAIMEYFSEGFYPEARVSKALCGIYNPDSVVNCFHYVSGSTQHKINHILQIKQIAENVKNGRYLYRRKGFFDECTHYYCIETQAYEADNEHASFAFHHYFETLDSFIDYLKGDLSYCDLSRVLCTNFDFSRCLIDETTKLPICSIRNYSYTVTKLYHNEKFEVIQTWSTQNGLIIKRHVHIFDYFCDFVAFLHGDLSNADLLLCDGIENVRPTDEINLSGALITSSVCEKWGIKFDTVNLGVSSDTEFSFPLKNETETCDYLQMRRDENEVALFQEKNVFIEPYDSPTKRIFYISDIHLNQLFNSKGAKTENDIIRIIRIVVETLFRQSTPNGIIIIDGDTSSTFSFFEKFVDELSRKRQKRTIIFTIGNHDLWSFPDDTVDEITEKYRSSLNEHDMYLLHNDLLLFSEYNEFDGEKPYRITEKEINALSEDELKTITRNARLIIFGGTGFSGYNPYFNANFGLYHHNKTINNDIDIKETKRFEKLYRKICSAFHGKNVVIASHMQLPDWNYSAWKHQRDEKQRETEYYVDHPEDNIGNFSAYETGFVYLSGHTHRNYYYDDGEIRIYADNQYGYRKNRQNGMPRLKYFEIDKSFDYFYDYKDGIYEITAEEYLDFYRGRNIMASLNPKIKTVFMLKKKNNYCFLYRKNDGGLSILNGGALSPLECDNIRFYYSYMDIVISIISSPLDKYSDYQKKISEAIKDIGGLGTIHGCIVDIDYYNHIYVNPNDNTVTAYWANNVIEKMVYPSIPALLKDKCPLLYDNYLKAQLTSSKESILALYSENEQLTKRPVLYLDTDIYEASNLLKKMQKLHSNILSTWPKDITPNELVKSSNSIISIK